MSPERRPRDLFIRVRDLVKNGRDNLFGADILDRHPEKFTLRIAIRHARGVINCQKPQRFDIVYPHRKRVVFKEEPISLPSLLYLTFDQPPPADHKNKKSEQSKST